MKEWLFLSWGFALGVYVNGWWRNRQAEKPARPPCPYTVGPAEETVAEMALGIDRARLYTGSGVGWRVEGSKKIRVRGRLYQLTMVELQETEGKADEL